MPANVGQMFWYGDVPWHGMGKQVTRPQTWGEALTAGDLDWVVRPVQLWAGERTQPEPEQSSLFGEWGPALAPVHTRKALVRSDRQPGDPDGVVGIVHEGFVPIQNVDGIKAFDSVFGRGRRVYETGGWLGNGERVWLLARDGNIFEPVPGDAVGRFILFANSHDGSSAIRVRRTAVRVVCQNIFALALGEKGQEAELRLRHSVSIQGLREDLAFLRARWTKEEKDVEAAVRLLATRRFRPDADSALIEQLFPLPTRPAAGAPLSVIASFEHRLSEAEDARKRVRSLVDGGHGTQIPGVRGSLWGLFNAVTEYADHHAGERRIGPGWSLFGGGATLKSKAWVAVHELARAA